MIGEPLDIGEVVERSGVPTSTLHVWEREGLLAPVGRAGLRRQYDPDVLELIAVIIVAQRSGFSLSDIREMLDAGSPADGASARATNQSIRAKLAAQLENLREQRRQLDEVITSLEHAVACDYPVPRDCPNFKALLTDVLPIER